MEFRKSTKADIGNIMKIIKQAQEYFRQNGIDQWQNNYPNQDVIENDIENEYGHLLLKDGKIVATVSISFDKEENYNKVYNGKWISNEEYAAIHRVAVDNDYKGLGLSYEIFNKIEKLCLEKDIHSIKIDTHKDNIPMKKMLKKSGFKYCGIIYVDDKSERIAFEKIF